MSVEFFDADFSEAAEGSSFTLPPEGTYLFTIHGRPMLRLGRESGAPYLAWQLRFADPGLAKAHGSIFTNTMLTGRGSFRMLTLLKALGYTSDEAKSVRAQIAPGTPDEALTKKGAAATVHVMGSPIELAGRQVQAKIKLDDGAKTPRMEVTAFLAPGA